MTSYHVLWFVAAICTLIGGLLLWIWGSDTKPPCFVGKKLLGYSGALICLTSSAIIVYVAIVMIKTMLTRIWLKA